MDVVIVSPSLDPNINISGISSVVRFILNNNSQYINYSHFKQGRGDNELIVSRFIRVLFDYVKWIFLLINHRKSLIHYNLPLTPKAILRDYFFIKIVSMFRVKILIHLHGGSCLMDGDGANFVINYILRDLFSLDCIFIALSNKEMKILQNRYRINKIFVLPNVVDLSESKKIYKKVNMNNPLKILFVGRLAKTKGLDFILDACLRLKEKNIIFKLIFAGEEERENQYIPKFKKMLGADYFIYKGVVQGECKSLLFKECDILLLPSFFEGLPLSLLECMSFGIVPVVTNVGSIDSCVEDGINGLFIQKYSVDDIVEKLIKLDKNRQLLGEFSIKAKKNVEQKFSPEKYIVDLNRIYHLCYD